jgi:hypothetical protein
VKVRRSPATVMGSKLQNATEETWEGVVSYEPEPGDLPVVVTILPTGDRNMAISKHLNKS